MKIPRLHKRYLFFIAAAIWTFAGCMLLSKGFSWFSEVEQFRLIKLIISFFIGLMFYYLMFSKLSIKHSKRIFEITDEKPYFYDFFNRRSYIIMICMISLGIGLRTSGLIELKNLSIPYIIMGIPLFLSSIRFYYFGIFYHKHKIKP